VVPSFITTPRPAGVSDVVDQPDRRNVIVIVSLNVDLEVDGDEGR